MRYARDTEWSSTLSFTEIFRHKALKKTSYPCIRTEHNRRTSSMALASAASNKGCSPSWAFRCDSSAFESASPAFFSFAMVGAGRRTRTITWRNCSCWYRNLKGERGLVNPDTLFPKIFLALSRHNDIRPFCTGIPLKHSAHRTNYEKSLEIVSGN